MKIVITAPGPQFSVQDVYAGWVEALQQLGQRVAPYNLDDRLAFYSNALIENTETGTIARAMDLNGAARAASNGLRGLLWETEPDALVVVSGFFVNPMILDQARAKGIKVVIIFTESPYEDDKQLTLAEHCDIVLLNDPTNAGKFEPVTGPGKTLYLPHAYRPSLHYPHVAEIDPVPDMVDFSFVGTGYPSRIEFFETMRASGAFDGVEVALAGMWQGLEGDPALPLDRHPLARYVAHPLDQCVDNTEAADLYRRTRVGINLYRREAEKPEHVEGLTLGPREIEMAACGLFFLRERRAEGDHLLDMLPTFESAEEAGELLWYFLQRPEVRENCAARARQAVAELTFENHARRLLTLLEG